LRVLLARFGRLGDSCVSAPRRLVEYLVEEEPAEPPAPALGQHVQQVEEAATLYGLAGTALTSQRGDDRHADKPGVVGNQDPGFRIAQQRSYVLDALRAVRPDALATSQVGAFVDRERCLELLRFAGANANRQRRCSRMRSA